MKLKSVFYSLLIASVTSTAYAQVKIGSNPGTIGATSNLEVESSSGNKTVIDKSTGNVGVGTTSPTNQLHINATNPLRLEGLQGATGSETGLLVDANGVVKRQSAQVSIPTVRASGGIVNAYNATSYAVARRVPIQATSLNDGNFSSSNNTYTASTGGVYMISGIISFDYSTSNQTVSIASYVNVRGYAIQIAQISGNSFPSTGSAVMSGSVTVTLSPGDTVYLSTISCGPDSFSCPQTYQVNPILTNLTITKML